MKNYSLTIILLFLPLIYSINPQCCQTFQHGRCITCPSGMHLYRANCIHDIPGCQQYNLGFDCSACRSGYTLKDSSCFHQRIPLEITNGANYTIYLDSAVRPDHLLNKAKKQLQSRSGLWIDWYNASLIRNKTYQSTNTLLKNAYALYQEIIGAQGNSSQLYYAHSAKVNREDMSYILYRFTYQLSQRIGFAQCLVGAQIVDGQINYIQLMKVAVKRLPTSRDWNKLQEKDSNTEYLLQKLKNIFPQIKQKDYIVGYYKLQNSQTNFTFFFENYQTGIDNYFYYTENTQLPRDPTVQFLISNQKTQQQQTNNRPSENSQNKKVKQDIVMPFPDSQTYKRNQDIAKRDHNITSKIKTNPMLQVNKSSFDSDPIFTTGYAVATQAYLPQNVQVSKLLTNGSHYAIIFEETNSKDVFYVFQFYIEPVAGQFKVLNFQKTNMPIYNKKLQQNEAEFQQTIQQKISQKQQTKSNQNRQPSKTIGQSDNIPLPLPPTFIPIQIPLQNQTSITQTSAQHCRKWAQNINVDVTQRQAQDLFLPRINLFLRDNFTQILQNTKISSANYTIGISDDKYLISNITYNIVYKNTQNSQFSFKVQIANNQFKLLQWPANLDEIISRLISENKNRQQIIIPSEINNPEQNASTAQYTQDSSRQNLLPNQQNRPIIPIIPIMDLTNGTVSTQTYTTNTQKRQQSSPKNNLRDAQGSRGSIDPTTQPYNSSSVRNSRTIIPQSAFKTESRFRTLIRIINQNPNMPSNATVISIQSWETQNKKLQYQVNYTMKFGVPLANGSQVKLYTYIVEMTQDFVGIKSSIVSFWTENELDKMLKQTQPQILKLSPQSIYLKTKMIGLSPALQNSKFQQQPAEAVSTKYTDKMVLYKQKLMFTTFNGNFCFQVFYTIFRAEADIIDQINLKTYKVVNCQERNVQSETKQKDFAFEISTLNDQLNENILRITEGQKYTVNFVKKNQNFYLINFIQGLKQKEIIVNLQASMVVLYQQDFLPALKLGSQASSQINILLDACDQQIQKFNIKDTQIVLLFNELTQNQDFAALAFYVRTSHKKYFKIQMLFDIKQKTNIHASLFLIHDPFIVDHYEIQLNSGSNMHQVSLMQIDFLQVAKKHLIKRYPTFMNNTQFISVVKPMQASSQSPIDIYKFSLIKKFTPIYLACYLVNLTYNTETQQIVVLGLETLPMSKLKVKDCASQTQSTFAKPICTQCLTGYRLLNGVCTHQIKGCIEYDGYLCLRCSTGQVPSQSLNQCLPDQYQRQIDYISIVKILQQSKQS